MKYELFGAAAHRYDLHTPPGHYQHDHRFVLEELSEFGTPCRILDVGCGTGVFLEKARHAGFEVEGIDASPEMVSVAAGRLGHTTVRLGRMQDLDMSARYDGIVALSWTFNYCISRSDAARTLERFLEALRPGGKLVLQLAHADHANGELREDREPGPDGEPEDVLFLYRFTKMASREPQLKAEYVYACRSRDELLYESHELNVAHARTVAALARDIGFDGVQLYESFRKEPFLGSLSPFLLARRKG